MWINNFKSEGWKWNSIFPQAVLSFTTLKYIFPHKILLPMGFRWVLGLFFGFFPPLWDYWEVNCESTSKIWPNHFLPGKNPDNKSSSIIQLVAWSCFVVCICLWSKLNSLSNFNASLLINQALSFPYSQHQLLFLSTVTCIHRWYLSSTENILMKFLPNQAFQAWLLN